MGISIVVGGQFGSEGKGKVTRYFANLFNADAVVRVGGCNSGHTVWKDGVKYPFKVLPVSSIDDKLCILAAGSYIDKKKLFEEIEIAKLNKGKLKIDSNAVVLDHNHKKYEASFKLGENIGSTMSGTGGAVIARISRDTDSILAKNDPDLRKYVCDTKSLMRNMLKANCNIVVEGTQGYGLSLLHTPYYPYATARDTSAAGFLSEIGLSPFDVDHIIMVLRSYPIRVAGNSGPLKKEITWKKVKEISGSEKDLVEYTTVTNKIRRVGMFDPAIVKKAIECNNPDIIVMNHIDYFDMKNQNIDQLFIAQYNKIIKIQSSIGRQINYVGNGEQMDLFRISIPITAKQIDESKPYVIDNYSIVKEMIKSLKSFITTKEYASMEYAKEIYNEVNEMLHSYSNMWNKINPTKWVNIFVCYNDNSDEDLKRSHLRFDLHIDGPGEDEFKSYIFEYDNML